ncbi:hypothetical protein [Mycobacterium sp. DL440]|uniref:hypothetical protein n=1 Tax=Mycobacterium sp. DL440 TaxID=2675523 RepID=UPI001FB98081|nr:hypothetical protein [Mycobacterium sp. DL440]
MAGSAVASAHLFGVDIHDLFDHKKKNKKSSPAAKVGPQRGGGVKNSGGSLGGPRASKSSKPESKVGTNTGTAKAGATKVGVGEAPGTAARSGTFAQSPQSARVGSTGQAPSAVLSGGIAQAPTAAVTGGTTQAPSAVVSGGGGGGGAAGAPTNGNLGRAPGLAPVPTAPSSRTIVIRSAPPKLPAAPAPAIATPPVAPAPVVAPPAPVISVPVPAAPPVGMPPAVPSAPTNPALRSEPPAAQMVSVPAVPESFRLGYADYLRMASTSDLLFAVLPGLGGMLLMTAAGGAVGFRQARAAQTLPSPQIARFLP